MPLTIGTRLGPYEILSAIGAGGMGEVYRARDSKLGRDVAIKVLPEAFARDADRMARFQREAKVLASLDHPNIATIHGLEDSGGTRALVMQLVEGPTLADRIKVGPIPIEEALPIARQICDALEYAHERGIIHRDLKPANVKVTSDDAVKVLDFGLAKALEDDPSSIDISASPTISRMATQQGVLLGTAAYMSPEQARAKPVDRRADIWAFGCVLYEMLTAKMAFRGETVTDTLAAVIKEEPDWKQLPAGTPVRVRVLLLRCLQKDPKQRLRDIGDARISLDEVISGAPEDAASLAAVGRPPKPWRLLLASGLAGLFLLVSVILVFFHIHQKASAHHVARYEIPLPEQLTGGGRFALSPDGRKLAFIGTDAGGQSRLWVRSLETLESHSLDGTEGVIEYPFWSPDSRTIGFFAQGKLKRIEVSGGTAVTLCDAPSLLFGGAWNRDGEIVLGSGTGLLRVSASGGSPSPLTVGGIATNPFFMPDGRRFVYLRATAASEAPIGIYVGSLDTKPNEQPSKPLLTDYSIASFTPSMHGAAGYLLFVRGAKQDGSLGTLMAQPFDAKRLELTGESVQIAEHVSNVGFSTSATDDLVYMAGGGPALAGAGARGIVQGQLTWFDREGKALETFGDPGSYRTLALSPDGARVAFDRADPKNPTTRNIWLYEFARGVTTRFTFDSGYDANPVWSPDGSRIAFGSSRGLMGLGQFNLYEKPSNLAEEDKLFLELAGSGEVPSSWSPDGRFLLYYTLGRTSRSWLLPLRESTADRKPIPLERSEFDQAWAKFSPDGRWIAYSSNESGSGQIYVRPFDPSSVTGASAGSGTPVAGKWMVSKDGGSTPLWRRDGKELFYLGTDRNAMAVEVSTSGVFRAGIPKVLFRVPPGVFFWDVSSDGERFIMAAPSASRAQPPFTVVLNWQAALKK